MKEGGRKEGSKGWDNQDLVKLYPVAPTVGYHFINKYFIGHLLYTQYHAVIYDE